MVSSVSAAARERLDAVTLTRMEEFSRDVQDFYLSHRRTDIPVGTRGRRCGTGLYHMVTRVRARRPFDGSCGWPASVERLTAFDWSWEANKAQRVRLSFMELATLPFLQQYWPTAVDRWPLSPTSDAGPLHRLCLLLRAWDDGFKTPLLLERIRRIGLDREDLRARVGGTPTYARLRVRSARRATQVASEQAALSGDARATAVAVSGTPMVDCVRGGEGRGDGRGGDTGGGRGGRVVDRRNVFGRAAVQHPWVA